VEPGDGKTPPLEHGGQPAERCRLYDRVPRRQPTRQPPEGAPYVSGLSVFPYSVRYTRNSPRIQGPFSRGLSSQPRPCFFFFRSPDYTPPPLAIEHRLANSAPTFPPLILSYFHSPPPVLCHGTRRLFISPSIERTSGVSRIYKRHPNYALHEHYAV